MSHSGIGMTNPSICPEGFTCSVLYLTSHSSGRSSLLCLTPREAKFWAS